MGVDIEKELDQYFLATITWHTESDGSFKQRVGRGNFGQIVTQTAYVNDHSYDILEMFSHVRRFHHITVDQQDPPQISRDHIIEFVLPTQDALVGIHSNNKSDQILVTAAHHIGGIQKPIVRNGSSHLELYYDPNGLVTATMQGDRLPSSEVKPSQYSWVSGVQTLANLARQEPHNRLEVYRNNALATIDRIKGSFKPQGEEIRLVDAKINEVLTDLIQDLPGGEVAASFRALETLGFREYMMGHLLKIAADPNSSASLSRLSGDALKEELAQTVNVMVETVSHYARRSFKKLLVADRQEGRHFILTDVEEDTYYETEFITDWNTGRKVLGFKPIRLRRQKSLGQLTFGKRIPCSEHEFVVDRKEGFSVQSFCKGSENWRVDAIPDYIDPDTRDMLKNPLRNSRLITDVIPIQPDFVYGSI